MLRIAACLLLLAELLAVTSGVTPFPHQILFSLPRLDWSLFSYALGGAFLIHLAAWPPRAERLSAAVLGLLFLASNARALVQAIAQPVPTLGVVAGCLGLGSLGVLVTRAGLRAPGAAGTLGSALLVPVLVLPTYVYLWTIARLHPITYDAFGYAFDGALAEAQPSFMAARLLGTSPSLRLVSALAYGALPLAFGALIALERAKGRVGDPRVVRATLIVGVVGFALYNVLPMAGPAEAFGAVFPARPPALGSEVPLRPMRLPIAMRNAMPSLHAAWSLLLFWNSRGHGKLVRLAALALLVLTLLSALGTGEHYLVDFVVALPLALAAQAAALPRTAGSARRTALLFGSALTLAWLAFLRFGWPLYMFGPVVAVPLAAATVVLSLLLERGLPRG